MLCGGERVNRAHEIIPKTLSRLTILCVIREQTRQNLEDSLLADVLRVESVEAFAVEAGADVKVVLARRAPRERDLGHVGTGTAIGTAAHADGDRLRRQAGLV